MRRMTNGRPRRKQRRSRIAADLDHEKSARPRQNRVAKGDRPLAGIRVLYLSRVIAGVTMARRTIAATGADVIADVGPDLPAIPANVDNRAAKLTSFLETEAEQGRGVLRYMMAVRGYFLARLSAARNRRASASRRRCRPHQARHSSM